MEVTASSVSFVIEGEVLGVVMSLALVDFDSLLGLELMFLGDLRRGIMGGGFVTKLSALILVELGSLFGRNFIRLFVVGLLLSSLLTLVIS